MSGKWVTKVGKALFPHLNEPDTKFEEDGVYTVNLILEADEAQELTDRLKPVFDEGYEKHCKERKKPELKQHDRPWYQEMDTDGNYTGSIVFKFKMKAKTSKGIEQRPALFDAKKNPMNEVIGNGSMIRVSFDPNCWFVPALGVGLSLRLRGVQVTKLVEYNGGRDANSMGFDDEDGFETASAMMNEDTATSSTSDF